MQRTHNLQNSLCWAELRALLVKCWKESKILRSREKRRSRDSMLIFEEVALPLQNTERARVNKSKVGGPCFQTECFCCIATCTKRSTEETERVNWILWEWSSTLGKKLVEWQKKIGWFKGQLKRGALFHLWFVIFKDFFSFPSAEGRTKSNQLLINVCIQSRGSPTRVRH